MHEEKKLRNYFDLISAAYLVVFVVELGEGTQERAAALEAAEHHRVVAHLVVINSGFLLYKHEL